MAGSGECDIKYCGIVSQPTFWLYEFMSHNFCVCVCALQLPGEQD